MRFGQLVVGPPGSGKTTYCHGIAQLLDALKRKFIIINLDFGADSIPYPCSIDVRDFTSVAEVMRTQNLGPNGALLYCFEDLLLNFHWIQNKLDAYPDDYIIIDCPGQVELYTHSNWLKSFIEKLAGPNKDLSMTCVHLLDSTLCADEHKYLSGLLVALSGQLMLELPHVNVLSKIDLLREVSDKLAFGFEFYAEVMDLSHLVKYMQHANRYSEKFLTMTDAICELIQDFNMIAFRPLDISDKDSVLAVLKEIDTANGLAMGTIGADLSAFKITMETSDSLGDRWGEIEERYFEKKS